MPRSLWRLGRWAGAALVILAGWWSIARAEVKSPADITADIEKSRGFKVLKLKQTTVDGRPAYLVTVMNSGGDTNSAFQVQQVLIDAQTGSPISTFHHGSTGVDLTPGPEYEPTHEGGGRTMRRDSFPEL